MKILATTLSILWVCGWHASAEVSAQRFARSNGTLDEERAARYIAARDGVSFDMVTTNDTWDGEKAIQALGDQLDDLFSKTGHEQPWTWQELDKEYLPQGSVSSAGEPVDEGFNWKKISGLTEAKHIAVKDSPSSGIDVGPIMVRKSVEDLSLDLSDASGAILGFSDNRLAGGNGAWNSQGVLGYPIGGNLEGGPGTGKSTTIKLTPLAEWQLAESQQANAADIEELGLAVPITVFRSPGWKNSALWTVQAKPFYQTDFSGGHEIFGTDASLEFTGNLFDNKIAIGGYQNFANLPFQYQVRIIPKLDYSETHQAGIHTTRSVGDAWFRAGGLVSFDVRSKTINPLEIGISYEFLDTLSGSGGYSSLLAPHLTWWLSDNLGLNFEYTVGDTPVADAEIDLLTLGLEFKY